MTVLPIIKGPDARLTQVSAPIDFEADQQVFQDLKDTFLSMRRSARGISAVQLGYLKRAFIIANGHDAFIFCNPIIEKTSNAYWTRSEGCLSYPWINGLKISRPQMVKGVAKTIHGGELPFDLQGWEARCFLHEMDHLNGITIEVRRRMKQNAPGIVR